MRYKIKNYDSNTTWYDLMMNMILGFLAMFVLALILISIKSSKNGEIEAHVEFLITSTWPSDFDDDIDLYVEDPQHNLVWFKSLDRGLMHLERDDRGWFNDSVVTPSGKIIYNENREVVSIRGFIAGEYVVNIHAFAKVDPRPVQVTVRLEKIRPYSTVTIKTILLTFIGEERTIFRFVVDEHGNVTNINTIPKRFTRVK